MKRGHSHEEASKLALLLAIIVPRNPLNPIYTPPAPNESYFPQRTRKGIKGRYKMTPKIGPRTPTDATRNYGPR